MYTSRNGGFSPAAAHCPSRSGAELCRRVAAEPVDRRPSPYAVNERDRRAEPLLARDELVEPVRVRRAACRSPSVLDGVLDAARAVVLGSGSVGPVLRDVVARRSRGREPRTRATSNREHDHSQHDQARPAARRRSGRSDSVDRTGRRRAINVGGHRLHSANGFAGELRSAATSSSQRVGDPRVRVRFPLRPLDRRTDEPRTRSSSDAPRTGMVEEPAPDRVRPPLVGRVVEATVPRSAGTSAVDARGTGAGA